MTSRIHAWFTDRRRIRIGHVMAIAAIALGLAALVPDLSRDPGSLYHDWTIHNGVGSISQAMLGWLMVTARPRNRAVWLFLWTAVFQGLNALGSRMLVWLDIPADGQPVPLDSMGTVGWIGYFLAAVAWLPGIAPLATLALLWFPDGRLPSPRWRPVEWLAAGATVGLTGALAWAVRPVDGMVSYDEIPGWGAFLAAIGISIVLSLCGLAVRFRSSRGAQRRRFRWIAWAAGLTAVVFIVGNLLDLLVLGILGGGPIFRALSLPASVVLPGGYAVAIWRHQLFDIDVVISRTLIWSSLAAFIGAVYVGVVFGFGSLIGRTSSDDATLSLAATALVAFFFQPVRRRVEHAANRLVFGRRATPYEVLAELSHRLVRTESTEGLLDRMVVLLADGVGAESAVVWQLRPAESDVSTGGPESRYDPLAVYPAGAAFESRSGPPGSLEDHSPVAGDGEEWIPIERSGERLGALTVTKRRGEELTPMERRLVEDLAGSAALVLDRARLNAALAVKADDLVQSRRRLVEAQTVERHRLQQRLQSDTHPHLTALASGLDEASDLAVVDGVDAIGTQLASLADEIRLAMEEIDGLASGMYPPVLESQGLTAAIEALAAGLPVPVDVRSTVSTHIDPHIEQAVYFTVGEALTNIVKHADASAASVKLFLEAEHLSFEVADDGRGFRPGFDLATGSGLAGLRDRIDTAGGSVTVASAAGRGTRISGLVPLAGAKPSGGRRPSAMATVDHRA